MQTLPPAPRRATVATVQRLTLILLLASKPSSWLSSSSMVRCTSLSPPPPEFSVLAEPMESTSSMKMIEGACSLEKGGVACVQACPPTPNLA